MKQKGVANIFVIILGIFIVFILFGYFKNNRILVSTKNTATTKKNVSRSKITHESNYPFMGCGIQIDTPAPTTHVGNLFDFSGQVTGCGWNAQNGIIGTLEILDSNNYSLTDTINVPVSPDGKFKMSIGLKNPTASDLGLVYLRSIDGLQVASFTIYFK
jgi:hypothetical protein